MSRNPFDDFARSRRRDPDDLSRTVTARGDVRAIWELDRYEGNMAVLVSRDPDIEVDTDVPREWVPRGSRIGSQFGLVLLRR